MKSLQMRMRVGSFVEHQIWKHFFSSGSCPIPCFIEVRRQAMQVQVNCGHSNNMEVMVERASEEGRVIPSPPEEGGGGRGVGEYYTVWTGVGQGPFFAESAIIFPIDFV